MGDAATAQTTVGFDRESGVAELGLSITVNQGVGIGWGQPCLDVRVSVGGEGTTFGLVSVEGSKGARAHWGEAGQWEGMKRRVGEVVSLGGGVGSSAGMRLRNIAESLRDVIGGGEASLR